MQRKMKTLAVIAALMVSSSGVSFEGRNLDQRQRKRISAREQHGCSGWRRQNAQLEALVEEEHTQEHKEEVFGVTRFEMESRRSSKTTRACSPGHRLLPEQILSYMREPHERLALMKRQPAAPGSLRGASAELLCGGPNEVDRRVLGTRTPVRASGRE
jgi:hypothetical protein